MKWPSISSSLKWKTCTNAPWLLTERELKGKNKLVKSLLKRLGISTSELKKSLKWMILESRQRNEEKGCPITLHIEFYFQLCTSHNLHCNYSKFCSIVAHRAFKPQLLVALVSFNSPLATVRPPIFSPALNNLASSYLKLYCEPIDEMTSSFYTFLQVERETRKK